MNKKGVINRPPITGLTNIFANLQNTSAVVAGTQFKHIWKHD